MEDDVDGARALAFKEDLPNIELQLVELSGGLPFTPSEVLKNLCVLEMYVTEVF